MYTRAPVVFCAVLCFDVTGALLNANIRKGVSLFQDTLLSSTSCKETDHPHPIFHPHSLPSSPSTQSTLEAYQTLLQRGRMNPSRLSCQERKKEFQKAFNATVIPERDDPCRNGKENCIVAITVYCRNNSCDPFYTNGIKNNIEAMRKVFPGWKLRVYTDGSMPKSVRDTIKADMSEEVVVKGVEGKFAGAFWRFFAASDPTVDRVIIRDSDNIVTLREKALVNEWIKSGKKYHSIRDHPLHTVALMAGMWGVMKKKGEDVAIPRSVIEDPARNGELRLYMCYKQGDQHFLWEKVWPLAQDDLIAHDSFLCKHFPDGVKPIPVPRRGGRDIVGYPNSYADEDELYECDKPAATVYSHMYEELTAKAPLACRPENHKDWDFN